jgi:hypothetical protein
MSGTRVKEARIILSARWNFRLFFIERLRRENQGTIPASDA